MFISIKHDPYKISKFAGKTSKRADFTSQMVRLGVFLVKPMPEPVKNIYIIYYASLLCGLLSFVVVFSDGASFFVSFFVCLLGIFSFFFFVIHLFVVW